MSGWAIGWMPFLREPWSTAPARRCSRFASNSTETDALVDDLAGHVALTEARHVHLLGDFLASIVEIRVESSGSTVMVSFTLVGSRFLTLIFTLALLKNTVLHISAVRQPLHNSATHGLCNQRDLPRPRALFGEELRDITFLRLIRPAEITQILRFDDDFRGCARIFRYLRHHLACLASVARRSG